MLNRLMTRQSVMETAIQRKIKPPCKDCSDRHLKCHSTCERYLDYRKCLEAEQSKIFNSRIVEAKLKNSKCRDIAKQKRDCNRGMFKHWLDYKPK